MIAIRGIRRFGQWFELVNDDPSARSFLRTEGRRVQTETVDVKLLDLGLDIQRYLDSMWDKHAPEKTRRAK